MGTHSRTNEVLVALYDVIEAAVASLDQVNAYDGPYATGDPSDAVHVGYDADPDLIESESARSERSRAAQGPGVFNETITVTNGIHVLNGADDIPGARVRGYSILGAVEDAIEADPTLGLSDMQDAYVSSSVLRFVGAELWLLFEVTVEVL